MIFVNIPPSLRMQFLAGAGVIVLAMSVARIGPVSAQSKAQPYSTWADYGGRRFRTVEIIKFPYGIPR